MSTAFPISPPAVCMVKAPAQRFDTVATLQVSNELISYHIIRHYTCTGKLFQFIIWRNGDTFLTEFSQ